MSINNKFWIASAAITFTLTSSLSWAQEAPFGYSPEIEEMREVGRLDLGEGEKRDILFLSVGSEHYLDVTTDVGTQISSFARIPGVNRSATLVSDLLLRSGAKFGVTLTSRSDAVVTEDDIGAALNEIYAVSREYADPFLVVYIASHGLASGFSETHFVIPGDLVVDESSLSTVDPVSDFYWHSLPVAEIGYSYIGGDLPYLMLVDSCRTSEDIPDQYFELMAGGEQSETMREVGEIAQQLGGSIGAPNFVFFSSAPGQDAATVADPFDTRGVFSVAPLARRLLLAAHRAQADNRSTLLYDLFLDMSVDPMLDDVTAPAHSNTPFFADSPDEQIYFYTATVILEHVGQSQEKTRHQQRIGTGTVPRLCCDGAGNAPHEQPEGRREVWLNPEMSVIWGSESE